MLKRIIICIFLVLNAILLLACKKDNTVDANYDNSPPTVEAIDYSPKTNIEETPVPKIVRATDEIIHDIVMDKNKGMYSEGEVASCAFLILDEDYINPLTKRVTGFVSFGEYNNENGKPVKIAGSGEIPTAITFNVNEPLVDYKYEEILTENNLENDVKKMFDEKSWDKVLKRDQKSMESIRNAELLEAKKLLDIK